jgi:hypothetical protein
MKIISKFKDYYDSVSRYGVDETQHYLRITNEISFDNDLHDYFYQKNYRIKNNLPYFQKIDFGIKNQYSKNPIIEKHAIKFDFYIIGFCGKIYPCIKTYSYDDKSIEFVYSYDDLIKFVTNCKNTVLRESFLNENHKIKYYYNKPNPTKYKNFFGFSNEKLNNLFIKENIPVFIVDLSEEKIYSNPCLKDFGFFKAKEPFTTYQDIFNYISGVLPDSQREIIEVSNDVKIHKAGFNEWSFRKEPKGK